MNSDDFQDLKERLREFADERDWDQFDAQGCANAAIGKDAGSGPFEIQKEMGLIL